MRAKLKKTFMSHNTGLADGLRQKEALAFHFNMSLTAINVARTFARQEKDDLLVARVKTLIHNAMMIHRFSVLSGKQPNRLLNTNDFKELLYYGVANAA